MIPSPSSPRRARLVGIAILAAVFAAGGLAGAATDRVLDARTPAPADSAVGAAAACPADERKTRILDQLDLTAEQRRQVDAIMARRRAESEAFWKNEGQRMRAIVDSARADVRAVLNPRQREEYERLREERRRRHEAERLADSVAQAAAAARR